MKPTDFQIMCALIDQVRNAAKSGDCGSVITLVSRPMWEAFNRAATPVEGTKLEKFSDCIYGSPAFIVERPDFWSVSKRK